MNDGTPPGPTACGASPSRTASRSGPTTAAAAPHPDARVYGHPEDGGREARGGQRGRGPAVGQAPRSSAGPERRAGAEGRCRDGGARAVAPERRRAAARARGGGGHHARARGSHRRLGSAAGSAKASIETSSPKPGVGQPVDFIARVTLASGAAPGKVEGPAFFVAGPGVAQGTRLDAIADGAGAFRVSFAFLQGGHFEVTFGARADGSAVRAGRTIDSSGRRSRPSLRRCRSPCPPAGAASAVLTPTAARLRGKSAKWL